MNEQNYADLLCFAKWVANKGVSLGEDVGPAEVMKAAGSHINVVRNMAIALLAKIEARE